MNEDLDGFFTMMQGAIEDIDELFKQLKIMKCNDWAEQETGILSPTSKKSKL